MQPIFRMMWSREWSFVRTVLREWSMTNILTRIKRQYETDWSRPRPRYMRVILCKNTRLIDRVWVESGDLGKYESDHLGKMRGSREDWNWSLDSLEGNYQIKMRLVICKTWEVCEENETDRWISLFFPFHSHRRHHLLHLYHVRMIQVD